MEFQSKDQNNLPLNHMPGFCDNQYLWKELTNILGFLHRDSDQERETLKVILFVRCD